jgi:RNA polymerase sigma-70 factor, ECF subfamily
VVKFPHFSYELEHSGSFLRRDAIRGREHSLPWSRAGTRKGSSKETADADAPLVARLKQRDQQAFLNLYDRYRRPVYRFLVHMTASAVVAEELTQDVFVAILDAVCSGTIESFDPGKGTLEGYLLGIARNLVREERRRTHRLVPLESVFETPEWNRFLDRFCKEQQGKDAETLLTLQSELRALYRAILALPDQYRETMVLCGIEERSYREAATILQCSEGTIASRMNRAKALLAAKLRGEAPDEVNASAT